MKQKPWIPAALGSPGPLIMFWPVLLLVAFVPVFAQPEIIVGYHWKTEFALALLIAVSLLQMIFQWNGHYGFARISKSEIRWVISPILLFTIWSWLSLTWAFSRENALHHSLVWTCYLIFYLLIRQMFENKQIISFSLKVTGIVVFIISMGCLIEYIGSVKPITSSFTYRYYKYAEAFAALIPLFVACSLLKKSKISFLAVIVASVAWLTVLLSLSRTVFIAGLVGIGGFGILILIFRRSRGNLKTLAAVLGILLFMTVITQSFLYLNDESTTISRISLIENSDRKNVTVRYLYWGLALESFKSKPIIGVGADNYISDYRNARERYSSLDPENKILESDEENLPERAHNEFLQILSELGLVGIIPFVWLISGIAVLFFASKERASFVTLASVAGMAGFLVSSLSSSYSFRVPANGLCFFFLVALFVQSLPKAPKNSPGEQPLPGSRFRGYFVVAGLAVCIVTLVFSGVRGLSLMYLANSQNTRDKEISKENLRSAMEIDPGNGLFRYYFGVRLLNEGHAAESIPHLRYAIDSGIATSSVFYSLISAQTLAGKDTEASKIYAEALRVYPRSVFLRTAYASYLLKNGRASLAEAEFARALKVDEKQARSWYLAHTEGLEQLSLKSNSDPSLIRSDDLYPKNGALALVNYQSLINKR